MGYSVGFDHETDYLACDDSVAFDGISSGTLEMFFRPRQLIDSNLTKNYYLFLKDNTGNNNGDAVLRFTYDTEAYRGALQAVFRDATTNQIIIRSNDTSWTSGTWYNVALQWQPGTDGFCMYVDGLKQTSTGTFAANSYPLSAGFPLNFGYQGATGNYVSPPVDFDEIRISTVARYSSNYTPIDRETGYDSDASTLCLYHCDEGSGTTIDNAESTAARDLQFGNTPVWVSDGGVISPFPSFKRV